MAATPRRNGIPLALVAILVATALVYWPGIHGGYVFDDFPNIIDNPAVHVTRLSWPDWVAAMLSSPSSALHRPLAMLTFAANHYFTGLDPAPMKITNIAIHLMNTLLVFGLLRSLLAAPTRRDGAEADPRTAWVAVFCTACWALHPINLMGVLFVVQRMESLCHAFVFAGLWAYVAGRARQQRGEAGWALVLAGIVGGTALGLLCKESAVLLPVYALCLEACVFGFRGAAGQRDPRMPWLFVVVLVLPGIVGAAWLLPAFLRPGSFLARDFTIGQRLLTEPRVVLDYVRWILVPDLRQYGLDHDEVAVSHGLWSPPTTVFAMAGIAVALAAAAVLRNRRPLVALGILWFFSAHLLTATVIPFELVFEHRNYFASLGLVVALGDVLLLAPAESGSVRRVARVVAACFLLLCAGTTLLRASEWSTPLRFAGTEAAKHPQSARATYSLARALIVASNYDPKSPLFPATVAALDRARRVPNAGVLPDHALLIFEVRTGAKADPSVWTDMQAKLRSRPLGPQEISALRTLTDCSITGLCAFDPNDMIATYGAAMSHGDDPAVMQVYGNYVLNVLGDGALAARLWQRAVELAPQEAAYRVSLIKLQIAQGRLDEARAGIARLRALGGLGQHASEADVLQARLQDWERGRGVRLPRP